MRPSLRTTVRILVGVAVLAGSVRVGAGLLSPGGGCRAGKDPLPEGAPPSTGRYPSERAGLWVINVDGSGETQLTEALPDVSPAAIHQFAWSPDSTAIGYVDPIGGGVVIIDAEGPGSGTPLHGGAVPPGPYVMGRAWSPDAQHLAWASNALEIESPGGIRKVVIPGGTDTQFRDPAWSPDGSRIAFGDNVTGDIEVVNVDGSGRRRIADNDRKYNVFGYAWSNDSRRIAFEAHGGYYGTWLGVVDADGTGLRRIARHCGGGGVAWSPDGERIAFSDAYSLRLVDPDNDNLTRIPNSWYGHSPVWSPDGRRIAFLRA